MKPDEKQKKRGVGVSSEELQKKYGLYDPIQAKKILSLKQSFESKKEQQGGRVNLKDKMEHLKRIREQLFQAKQEQERLTKYYFGNGYLGNNSKRNQNKRECRCAWKKQDEAVLMKIKRLRVGLMPASTTAKMKNPEAMGNKEDRHYSNTIVASAATPSMTGSCDAGKRNKSVASSVDDFQNTSLCKLLDKAAESDSQKKSANSGKSKL